MFCWSHFLIDLVHTYMPSLNFQSHVYMISSVDRILILLYAYSTDLSSDLTLLACFIDLIHIRAYVLFKFSFRYVYAQCWWSLLWFIYTYVGLISFLIFILECTDNIIFCLSHSYICPMLIPVLSLILPRTYAHSSARSYSTLILCSSFVVDLMLITLLMIPWSFFCSNVLLITWSLIL